MRLLVDSNRLLLNLLTKSLQSYRLLLLDRNNLRCNFSLISVDLSRQVLLNISDSYDILLNLSNLSREVLLKSSNSSILVSFKIHDSVSEVLFDMVASGSLCLIDSLDLDALSLNLLSVLSIYFLFLTDFLLALDYIRVVLLSFFLHD